MELEEALAQADVYAEETEVCMIDNDLRTITVPSGLQTVGVESDEDVRRLNFQMPKQYGEVDLSEFNIRINFLNANNSGDVYAVTDKAVSGDNITFSWLVGRNALAYRGNIRFIVCLKKADAEGVVQQEFNTTVARLTVLEGLETTEAVVAENPDIIEQILQRLDELEENGGGGGSAGKDGREIELQNNGTVIQWRYKGEEDWVDLVQLSEITGKTPNIKIGEVTTLEPGTSATATITGTPENPLLNLGIPAGQLCDDGGSTEPTSYNLVDPSEYTNSGYSGTLYNEFGANINVFNNEIDTTDNKLLYYRVYRNNQVMSHAISLKVGCYSANGEFLFLLDDLVGDYIGNFENVSQQAGTNSEPLETIGSDKVIVKSIALVNIPENVAKVKFGVPGNSNMIKNFYPAFAVSYSKITNYGSITNSDYSLTQGATSEDGGSGATASKPLLNKTFLMIGDSLTNWGGGGDTQDGFLKIIHDRTGVTTVNQGLAGATWEEAGGQTQPGVKRVDTYVSGSVRYDCIGFLLGTNVANQGNTTDTSSTKTTMCGAIKYCLEKLIALSPTTPIIVFLPPQRAEGNEGQKTRNDLIRQICEMYAVPTFDLYARSQVIPNTVVADNGTLSDGLHLSAKGQENIGRIMTSSVLDVMGF